MSQSELDLDKYEHKFREISQEIQLKPRKKSAEFAAAVEALKRACEKNTDNENPEISQTCEKVLELIRSGEGKQDELFWWDLE